MRQLVVEITGRGQQAPRLSAAEQWMGARPDTSDLDQQIEQARSDRHAATDADDFDQAALLRDRERELLT